MEVWDTDSDEDAYEGEENENDAMPPIIRYLLIFIMFWQAVFNISNNAIGCLLRFISFFIRALGRVFRCTPLNDAGRFIPITPSTVHKILGIDQNGIIEYVVCPKCDAIYKYQDTFITLADGRKESRKCSHVAMPNHPFPSQRQPCGAILLKTVKTKHNCKLVPLKTYPYCSLKERIQYLINQEGFLQKCEQWRDRSQKVPPETLGDIYDGEVWKMFHDKDHNEFLKYPYSYLLSLNVDWFQPFSHIIYSTDAIYLTIYLVQRGTKQIILF